MNKPAPFLLLLSIFLVTFCLLVPSLGVKNAAGQWTHLDYGDYVSAFIDTVGEVDIYTFYGNPGEVVMIRMAEAHIGLKPSIQLYEAGSSFLEGNWGDYYASIVDEELPASDSFFIRCADSGSAIGEYRLKLLCRNHVQVSGMQVYYGDTLRSYLDPGDIDAYRFWSDSGDVVMIRMAEVTAALRPDLSVYRPDNTLLHADFGDKYASIERRLAEWGMYTFYCDEVLADDGGHYRVKLLCRNAVRDSGRLISYGTTIVDTLYLGDVKGYRFEAEMGDTLTIRMAEIAQLAGDFDPLVSLYGPEDTLLQTEGDTILAAIEDYVLDSSGIYTVYCDDQGVDASGEYVLELLCWNTFPDSARLISCGELVPETLSLGRTDTYCFDGDSGDVVMIRMAEVSTSLQPKVSLYRPDHTLLDSISDNECASLGDVTLLSYGTYTIFCDDRGSNDSGEYRLKLLCRNKDGMEISYRYWNRKMLNLGDIDAYRFEGEAGDVVMIRMLDAEVTRPLQPIISLYGPHSDSLAADYADGDHCASIVDYTLPTDGIYALFCDDEKGNDSGDYCIKLLCRNFEQDSAMRISYGDTIIASLRLGDINAYAFEGKIGDTVMASMAEQIGDFEPWISLYGTNNQLLDTDWNSDRASLEAESLQASGIYTIYCDDSPGNDSGTYLLKLSSPNAGPIDISYGDLVYGVLASSDTNVYRFGGREGDKVVIRLLADWGYSARLELFDPWDTLLIHRTDYGRADIVDYILPRSDSYTIFVMGEGTGSYSLSLQCRQHVKDLGDTVECEAQVSSSASPRGDMDAYLFLGNMGDTVTIELQELSGDPEYRPCLELFDSSLVFLDGDCDSSWASISNRVLEYSGYYIIFTSDEAGEDTGSYLLSLECERQQEADTIGYDTLVASSITLQDAVDAYVFWGEAGEKVIIRLLGDWATYPRLELYDPADNLTKWHFDYWRADIKDFVLVSPGYHTILVTDEARDDKGSYTLSLQCRQHVQEHGDTIHYDTLLTSSIFPLGDMDAYLFLGDFGDTITIELRELSGDPGYRPWLELFDPSDNRVQQHVDDTLAYVADLVLDDFGYYTIFVSDEAGEDTGSYSLSLEVAPMDTTPPTFDHRVTSDSLIAIDQIVIGIFSEPVREATVNKNTFILKSSRTGRRIDGEIEYDGQTTILVFIPESCYLPGDSSRCFPPDDTINALLTEGIEDMAGNPLDSTEWQIATGPGVYPGDTNNDGVVNEVDVLPLGVFWLHTGAQRDSTAIDWSIMPVRKSWTTLAAMYADADGNGTVELEDLDAISSNWGKRHRYYNPVFSPGDLDSLSSDSPYMEAFEELYQDLKDEGPEEGDKIREIFQTILTSTGSPLRFTLSQNFPNPFNPKTEIRYFLPRDADVELAIYNILGEKVKSLVTRFQTAGAKKASWDGTSDRGEPVASGIYFCRIRAGEFEASKKMLLLR